MHPTELLRQTLLWLRYRNAAFVNSLDELEAAINRAPPRIVVDGDEALRAYAAAIATPHIHAAEVSQSAALLAVSPVGRIRDGYKRRSGRGKTSAASPDADFKLLLLVIGGTAAGLGAEWISYVAPWPVRTGPLPPQMHPRALPATTSLLLLGARLAIFALGAIALICFGRVVWQALSLGSPRRTEWRVEYRVPGRLVMVRLRRRATPGQA